MTDEGDPVWKGIIPVGWANAISGLSSGKYVIAGAFTGKIWLYKINENGNEAR